jgi:hypothetical protein
VNKDIQNIEEAIKLINIHGGNSEEQLLSVVLGFISRNPSFTIKLNGYNEYKLRFSVKEPAIEEPIIEEPIIKEPVQ